MANENQNTGPNTQGPDPKALRDSLKALLEDQGDFNNLLKTTISDLKRMDGAYAKIEARLSSLNKDSINVRQVNQELLRLRQKEFLESKKLSDLQSSFSNQSKRALSQAKELTKDITNKVEQEQMMFELLQLEGNLEAIALYTAEKQLEIAQKQTKQGEEMLKNEKQVARQLGISGNLMKVFAEKLGVGEEAYAAMSAKARNLVEEQKKMNVVSAFFSRIVGGFQVAFTGLGSIIKSAFSYILDPATIVTGLGLIVKGFVNLVQLALSTQDRTVKFGRALGLSASEAQKVRNQFTQIAFQSNNILVNSEKLMQSQEELTGILGTNNILSKQILETDIQLKDLAGLEADTRAEIARTSVITGQSSEAITKSVLAQVVGLRQATGISFNYQRILKEASNLGGYLGLSFSKYPAQLTKSLVTVKAMGLELKQLDSLADSFLEFESSISKEFEAQLLTGREINLTKAREAFLNNDLTTAASEITRQVGSANDFLKLNRIQAESLASAFGMSRDQMAEMLKQQEFLSRIGAKQGDSAREQLRLGLERFKTQKALTAAIGEEAYQSLVNASAQEKLAGFIDRIKQSLADFISTSPLIPLVEKAINWLSSPDNIRRIVSYIQGAFATIFDVFGSIASGVMKVLDFLPGIDIDDSLIEMVGRGGDSIRALNLAGAVPQSVGNTAAAGAVSSNPNQIPTGNSMSMAKSPEVYVVVNVDPITGVKTQKVITKDIYERQFGPMTNQYKSGS